MRFAPLLLAALCALVLFTGLDQLPFVDQREARDALVARELIERREVLTPLMGGEPHFEKPVSAYAPEALVVLGSANRPLHSRLWRAALAAALLLLIASIGAEHFGARAGWLTAIVMASALVLPLAARTDGTQLMATFLGWLGCSGFADATFGRRHGRTARLIVSYGALAATLVIAGPLPALWPLGAVALYAALTRRREVLSTIQPLAGLTLMIGIALPWYGAMLERHGANFASHMLFFPYAVEARGPLLAGPVLMLSLLVVGCFPWSALLPGALLHAATWWRLPRLRRGAAVEWPGLPLRLPTDAERERREEHAAHFFIACLVASLAPILFYPGPPLPAALPALPAVALLCARLLDHAAESEERVSRPIARGALMLGVVGTAGALLFAVMATRLRDVASELQALAAATLLLTWLPFLASFLGRKRIAAGLFVLPVAVGTPLVALRLLPAMQDYLQTRGVAEAMEQASPPRAPLVVIDPAPPSLQLALHRNLVVAGDLNTTLRSMRASDGHSYLAFRPLREHDVARTTGVPLEILMRSPALILARVRMEPAP